MCLASNSMFYVLLVYVGICVGARVLCGPTEVGAECTPAVLAAAVGELVGLFVPFVITVRAHVRAPQLSL